MLFYLKAGLIKQGYQKSDLIVSSPSEQNRICNYRGKYIFTQAQLVLDNFNFVCLGCLCFMLDLVLYLVLKQ